LSEAGVSFEVVSRSGAARAGILSTRHGPVRTPAFMPVATQGTVKAMTPDQVKASGAQMLIMNTYHLWLRPGPAEVKELGGLHAMCRWQGPIVTDSGGFQAFSLAERTKLREDGFEFASHIDGKRLHLTPEGAMEIQAALGSDVAMQLDVCPPGAAPRAEVEAAVERTTRWARRTLEARDPKQAVFGIVQGGVHADLRKRHAAELAALTVDGVGFDGLALGGFSVGEPPAEMHALLPEVAPYLDAARVRYLMGVGTPQDLLVGIGAGVDLFDCVMPTRNARNGHVFVTSGRLNMKNAAHRADSRVIEPGCDCSTCAAGYTRAYLRHLYVAGEMSVFTLLSAHNLRFYARLLEGARDAISRNEFAAFQASYFSPSQVELK
jgi:queuine tRNA-ribosyltransferase